MTVTVKPVISGHSKKRQKMVFKTDYRLMQVKSIAEYSKTFIKPPFVFKTFVLSILSGRLRQVLLYIDFFFFCTPDSSILNFYLCEQTISCLPSCTR